MSFFYFMLRQNCDKDFVLLQIVLQKTEILESRKDRIRSDYVAHTKNEFYKCVKIIKT